MKQIRNTPGTFAHRFARLALILFAGLAVGQPVFAQLPDANSQAALNTINSDLTQEIEAGSTNAGTLASPVYLPTSNLNMLPNLVGSSGTGGLENLLKISTQSPFYSGVTFSGTGAIRASPALTTGTSEDGRFFTPASWNLPLFLPVTGGSDYTPALTTGSFSVPNWIAVAQDGSNPTAWSSGLITTSSSTNPVVSRYAYAIYHEGGLLDANVAGYPSTSSTSQIEYKLALPYADLTQIGLTPSQIDTLVGSRNYASTQAPGTSTAPDFTAASGSNYYQFVLSNTNGFLSPSTAVFNGQTDQTFSSRQQLINFMQNDVGLTGTGLDTLNYLATFTRGINQPSVAPDPTRPLIPTTNSYTNGGNNLVVGGISYELIDGSGKYDPVNPNFLNVSVTGTFLRNDGSTAVVGEPLVNKRFALSRLAWLTYLGPSANRTLPVTNPGVNSPNYDMWQLVHTYGISPAYLAQGTAANIYKYFGLVWMQDTWTPPTLQSGEANTPGFHDNEYKWFYMGHQTFGFIPGGAVTSNKFGSISRLQAIANLGSNARDPDFFELLKASVAAGSLGKASLSVTTLSTDSFNFESPYVYQALYDANLDYAIIQLGANIIDQAKVDGYSTRIVFNDGAGIVHEFRGVQNLPYLYRFNSGDMDLREENPAMPEGTHSFSGTLKDTGIAVVMEVPTIWNPYDANSPPGIPGPVNNPNANFRIIADSAAPDSLAAQTASASTAAGLGYNTFNASAENSNGTTLAAGTNASQKYWSTATNGGGTPLNPPLPIMAGVDASALVPSNAEMDFNITTNQLFREPTILAMSGYPSACNLRMPNPPTAISQISTILNTSGSNVLQQSGGNYSLSAESPNPLDLPGFTTKGQGYVGVCAAIYPMEFTNGTTIYHSDVLNLNASNGPGPFLTFRLQYQDPNASQDSGGAGWITYDEKYTEINTIFLDTPFDGAAGNLTDAADQAQGGDWQSYADPRTSRFAAVNGRDFDPPVSTPGESGQTLEWADLSTADGIGPEIVTNRPDVNAGYPVSSNRGGTPYEFAELVAGGWFISTITGGHFRTSMLSQNSPNAFDNGIRFNGDLSQFSTAGDGPQHTYYEDPDNVVRGAMGWYVPANGFTAPATTTVGLPLATAYAGGPSAFVTTGAYQAESRPYFLHRPFRSVAELSYVFSGTPWKNIDFFTPQSGNASMLDIFSINETPPESANPDELVAGTVNLNTHQTPVLQAILSGAYVDEAMASGTVSTPFTPFTGQQANALLTSANGTNLLARTTGTTAGLGPLQNVSELVGQWNSSIENFTGPSGDLGGLYAAAFGGDSTTVQNTMQYVDRFRESFIRPLAAVGNTRVWNLMIDLIVQNGQYPGNATSFDNFAVNTEQRYWVHEAIDRYTGKIVDQSVETVGPDSLTLSGSSIADGAGPGTVATLGSVELTGSGPYTFALASGTGTNDNGSFTLSGNTLQFTGTANYFTKTGYTVLVTVTDTNGLSYTTPVTIAVQAAPYKVWKVANFGASASNPTVAGDLVDSQNDGLPNLLKYALGLNPNAPATTGITVQGNATTLTMNYTQSSAATDVTVSAAVSTNPSDPTSWTSSGVTQTMISDNGTIQQWQATAPVNANTAMFMRLTVTDP